VNLTSAAPPATSTYALRTPRELEEFLGVLGPPWMLCCFLPATIWFNLFMPPENTEQRKLAAVMFTDMVGYSALRCWLLPGSDDLAFGEVRP